MRATWAFRAARPRGQHSWIRRKCGTHSITGTEREALEFAGRIRDHLHADDGNTVQAWTLAILDSTPEEIPDALTFRIVPHENGKDWQAVQCSLQHPLWISNLEQGVDYMLFRGGGKLCAIHVMNRTGLLDRVILADHRQVDSCPFIAPSVTSMR